MVRFWSCTTSKSALPDSTRLLSAWTSPSSAAAGGRREALPWTLSNRNLGEGRQGLILQQQPAVGRDPREPSVRPQGMHKILRYTVSILSWYLLHPVFSSCLFFFPSFSANILGWSRSCLVDTILTQVTGMLSLLSVCTQGRGDGESQTEEVASGMTAPTNS